MHYLSGVDSESLRGAARLRRRIHGAVPTDLFPVYLLYDTTLQSVMDVNVSAASPLEECTYPQSSLSSAEKCVYATAERMLVTQKTAYITHLKDTTIMLLSETVEAS